MANAVFLFLVLCLFLAKANGLSCTDPNTACPLTVSSPTEGATPSDPLPYDGRQFFEAAVDVAAIKASYPSYDIYNDPGTYNRTKYTSAHPCTAPTVLAKISQSRAKSHVLQTPTCSSYPSAATHTLTSCTPLCTHPHLHRAPHTHTPHCPTDQLYTFVFSCTEFYGRSTLLAKVGNAGAWPHDHATR